MSEAPHRPSRYMSGWNGYYEREATDDSVAYERSALVVIDDNGEAKPLPEQELDIRGMGHIVTIAAIPPQRKPPDEETIVSLPEGQNESRPLSFRPDSSIYLG